MKKKERMGDLEKKKRDLPCEEDKDEQNVQTKILFFRPCEQDRLELKKKERRGENRR